MDPEELQSIADEQGLPVEHFDGYSVVHHPSGPMTVAHSPGARVPVRSATPVVGVPSSLARPVDAVPPASIATSPAQQRADALRRDATAQRAAFDEQQRQDRIAADWREIDAGEARRATHGRTLQQERDREAEARDAVSEPMPADGSLPPSVQRQLEIDRETVAGRAELSGLIGSGALHRAAVAHGVAPRAPHADAPIATGAGVTTGPDGSQADTATGQPLAAPPSIVPRSWLVDPAAGLREGARSAVAEDAAMRTPAIVTGASLPRGPSEGAPGVTTGPTLEQAGLTPESAAVRSRSTVGGTSRGGGVRVPMGAGPVGAPLPPAASDATIAGLAGEHAAPRRDPDLVDRQLLVERQRAGLAGRAAQTQAQIEAQAEQQRQQLEQDRQSASTQAMRAYQNAIQRVASARIDPDRWYRDQGAGGVVGATIAVALGALGGAFTGSSTNGALEQINGAIERDIDAQRSEIESGRAAAEMQGNMIGIVGQEFTDRQAANDAAHAAMLQQAALQVQRHQADLQDQEAQNNADALRQQLEREAATRAQAAVDRELQRRLTAAQVARTEAQAMHEARLASGAGAHRAHAVTPTQMDAYRQIVHSSPDIDPAQAAELAGLPPGFVPREATDPTTASAVQALEGELSHLESLIPSEGDIPGVGPLDRLAPSAVTSDQGRAVRRSAEQVVELLGRLHSGGAISDEEADRFTAIVGAGATQTDSDLRGGIETIRREIGSRLRGRASDVSGPDRDLAELGDGARWLE